MRLFQAGLTHWIPGFTRAQVVHSFLTSAEYEQGVETISRLYYAVNKQALDLASLQTLDEYLSARCHAGAVGWAVYWGVQRIQGSEWFG